MGKPNFSQEIEDMIGNLTPTESEETEETEDPEDISEEATDDEEPEEGEEDSEEATEEETEDEESEESEEEEIAEAEEFDEQEEESEESEESTQPDMSTVLNELASGEVNVDLGEDEKPKQEPPVETPVETPPDPSGQLKIPDTYDPLKGYDFDEVTSDPKTFSAFIRDVGSQIQNLVLENAMRSTMNIVGSQVHQQLALKQVTDAFWQENSDLEVVKPYVAKVAETIQSRVPDMPVDKVLVKTAEIVRKKLNITKGGGGAPRKPSGTRRQTKPAIGKKGGKTGSGKLQRKGSSVKPSKLESEIADLLEDY
jgi:hypothetical protein